MSFHVFQLSSVRVDDFQKDDTFYVYPDNLQKSEPLPETLDDAYGNGFLTISLWDDKFDTWYMTIGNEEYTGSLQKLESVLYAWASSEGYQFV